MRSMRDDLNAALDATKEADPSQNYDETPQEVLSDESRRETNAGADSESVSPSAGAENSDRVDNVEKAKTGREGEESESERREKEEPLSNQKPVVAESKDSIKAPIDWGPKERESWSKIPRNLQEKIRAREKQIVETMQSTAEARRTHEAFSRLTQQYGAVLSGIAGDTPIDQANTLFSTVANLRMGSPIQKAQIIADMINDFGVDIHTLDSALVGQAVTPEHHESSRIEQLVAERLAPFEQLLGQQNAYKQQQVKQVQEAANNEVLAFAQNAEFINDVRLDMADLLDLASKRGYQMTMQEAYDKACALKPDIQAVLTERQQRAALFNNNNDIAGKRRAASSVNGRQAGVGGSTARTLRETIAEAWDTQGRV